MKIKKLKVKNYAGIEYIEVVFGDKVTHIVGLNGDGKTTLLNTVWACLNGVGERGKDILIGDRWRIIGKHGKSADIEMILVDEFKDNAEIRLNRKITKNVNQLTFEAPDGYPINNEWISNLFSVAFFNIQNFTRKTPQEQALLLGINTEENDKKIAEIKDEAKAIRKTIKGLGVPDPVEKVDTVDVEELDKEKSKIASFNVEQSNTKQALAYYENDKIVLERQKAEIVERIDKLQNKIAALPELQDKKSLTDIQTRINEANVTNSKAWKYRDYLGTCEFIERQKAELEDNQNSLDAAQNEKTDYIKSFDFGFKGLSVDENGGLTYTDKPGVPRHIKERSFSTGELYNIVARLHASTKPKLKTVFIDNFESLDKPNQDKIIKTMNKLGLQVITASVGNDASADNTILLRECAVVKNNEEKELPSLF